MTRDEILQLYTEKKRKRITNKSLAEAIGCSESLISHYFNFNCNISPEKEQKLVNLIHQAKEYRWQKVCVD
ncbi:helix-turn-helix domain-containing protein [Tuberibacillus calidus]|jgi:transcriptional regulator with XRE-family HTH domain|uniref:helix-turn-helix domain-containing protein n=1 Tax=Tuberibacillus calidus TaxID=340097 RepID=UPI00041F7AD6|nr:helix-turn-helix transcriptional regulator [Tuberibacillus calidus]